MKKSIYKSTAVLLGLSMCVGVSVSIALNSKDANKTIASSYSTNTVPTTLNLNDLADSDIRLYYSALNSKSDSERQGTNLLKNLKPILKNGQKYFSYGSSATTAVWQAYEIVDRDWDMSPASAISGYNATTNTVTGYVYGKSNSSVGTNPYIHALYVNRSATNQQRAWGNHNQEQWGINQEHIWAKSCGFNDNSPGTGARGDLMHLWAGNGKVNGTYHSNYYYGYVDKTKSYDNAGTYASTLSGNLKGYSKTFGGSYTVFEPQDSDKGDIARALFYMAARYNYLSGSDSDGIDAGNPNLEIVNLLNWAPGTSYTSSTTKKGQMGILQDLLEWNRIDPPDQWEIHRNNLLYRNFTNNRNPFIDFPEWAEFIWGKSTDGSYSSTSTGVATPTSDTINDFSGGVTPEERTLVSISVSGQKTNFNVGDTFSFGGTVTATYDDSSTANVTSSATFSGYDMSTSGEQTVTVSYTEDNVTKTTTYVISIDSAAPQVVSVTGVTLNKEDISISVGDEETLIATVSPTDATNKSVTWSTGDSSVATVEDGVVTGVAAGSTTITVTTDDGGFTDTCSVTVSDSDINYGDGTLVFGSTAGHNINDASVNFDDNLENNWTITTAGTSSYTSNPDYSQVGSAKKPATSITFTTTLSENMKISNFTASFGGFSGSAGSITLKVDDTTVATGNINATTDVTVTQTGNVNGKVLTITITGISKGIKAYSLGYKCEKIVVEPVLTGITLDIENVITEFDVGDTFDYDGLIVTASYDIKDPEEVTPTSVSSPDMSTAGTKTITVTYTEGEVTKTATYEITVTGVEPTLTSITLDTTNVKTEFEVDDTFTYDGLVVTANYDNQDPQVVTPTSVSSPDMSTEGDKEVTVTYTENNVTKTATYEITVSSVTPPTPVETGGTTVNLVMSEQGYTNGQVVTNISFYNNNSETIEATPAKGTHTKNSPAYYTSDLTLRFYAGNTLTITSSKQNIIAIHFKFLSLGTYSGPFTANVGTYTQSSTEGGNWTGLTNSVVFSVGSSQLRVLEISVTYYDATSFANDFLSETSVCDASGKTNKITSDIWSSVKSKYNDRLFTEDQNTLKGATGDENGTVVEHAMKRYDIIATKYYSDDNFIGRTLLYANTAIIIFNSNNNSLLLFVTISSTLILVAFIYLRKKQDGRRKES